MRILDTNTLAHLFRGHQRVVQRYQEETDQVATTIISRIEIFRGRFAIVLKAANGQELRRAQQWLDEASERSGADRPKVATAWPSRFRKSWVHGLSFLCYTPLHGQDQSLHRSRDPGKGGIARHCRLVSRGSAVFWLSALTERRHGASARSCSEITAVPSQPRSAWPLKNTCALASSSTSCTPRHVCPFEGRVSLPESWHGCSAN